MRDKLRVMTKQKSQNLLLKVDPLSLSTIRNNKFITQGEKLEIVIAKVRVFVLNILLPPFKAEITKIWVFVFFSNARRPGRRWTACV